MHDDYEARCKAAATRQGLDPIIAALTARGVSHSVEQTGGFTMVVTVEAPHGTLAFTAENEAGSEVLVGFYPGDDWTENREGATYHTSPTALAAELAWLATTQEDDG